MESIRNFLKSPLGIVFLILCLSPLAILGLESYFRGGSDSNEVAKVGAKSISRSEYQNAISTQRNEIISNGVEQSSINNTALNQKVLKDLLNFALLKHQTQALGMHISDQVINDLLLKNPQYLDEAGQFSNERFAFALKQQGLTKSQLFNQYREQLNVAQLYNSITQTALYSDNEVAQLIALQEEARNTWLYRIPWQDLASKVTVTDNDISDYFNTHQKDLDSLAMVDLTYIVLNPELLETESVTEEDIQEQYAAYKAGFSGDLKQKVSQILVSGDNAPTTIKEIQQRLQDGSSFETLAKEYSEDTTSGAKGGDIGTLNTDVFGDDAPKVQQALQGLKVGDVSKPIKTNFGYQIFKVTDLTGEVVPTLDTMREQLTARAAQQKKEILFAAKVTRINDMATDGVSIADIAQQEGLTVKSLKDFTELNNTTVLNQPAVIEAAFDEFTIQDESVSTNISVDNVTVWVQPANYRPVMPLTLEQASNQIKQTLTKQKAIDLALNEAQTIATKVNSKGIDDVNVDFMALGEVNRQNPVLRSEEKAIAFSQDSELERLTAVAQKTDIGASVLVVDSIKQSSIDNVPPTEVAAAADALRQNRGQEQFSDYLHYLDMAIEVTKNDGVINEIAGL